MTDGGLRGGFGAEDALEARAGELNTDEFFPLRLDAADMDDAALRGEVGFTSARREIRRRDTDLQVRTDGHIEAREESGAISAKILAGSFFLEENAAGIAAAHVHGQMNGDPTFRALPGDGRRERDHGLGPRFPRSQSDRLFRQPRPGRG